MFLWGWISLYWIYLPLLPSVCDYIVLGRSPSPALQRSADTEKWPRGMTTILCTALLRLLLCRQLARCDIRHHSWTLRSERGKWDDVRKRFPPSSGGPRGEYSTRLKESSVWNLMCICSQFFSLLKWSCAYCLHPRKLFVEYDSHLRMYCFVVHSYTSVHTAAIACALGCGEGLRIEVVIHCTDCESPWGACVINL